MTKLLNDKLYDSNYIIERRNEIERLYHMHNSIRSIIDMVKEDHTLSLFYEAGKADVISESNYKQEHEPELAILRKMLQKLSDFVNDVHSNTTSKTCAKVISAFPGCGKSTYYKEWSQYSPENAWRRHNNGEQVYCACDPTVPVGDKIIDSDSSLFSWIYDENGNKTDVRNPDFPNNYIQHIKEHLETEDIIFVSSHKVVRDALRENGIAYTLVYPQKDMLDDFLWRYKHRGNTEEFIKYITDNWDNFIDEMDQETFPEKLVLKPWTSYNAITTTLMNDIVPLYEVRDE